MTTARASLMEKRALVNRIYSQLLGGSIALLFGIWLSGSVFFGVITIFGLLALAILVLIGLSIAGLVSQNVRPQSLRRRTRLGLGVALVGSIPLLLSFYSLVYSLSPWGRFGLTNWAIQSLGLSLGFLGIGLLVAGWMRTTGAHLEGIEPEMMIPHRSDHQRPLSPSTTQRMGSGPSAGGSTYSNGLATASFVLSIVGIVACGIGSFLGVIFGHVARTQIRQSEGRQGGMGLATAGLVIGYVGIGLMAIGVVLVVFVLGV